MKAKWPNKTFETQLISIVSLTLSRDFIIPLAIRSRNHVSSRFDCLFRLPKSTLTIIKYKNYF